MEIQHGKGPWAPPVSGIVPLGSTLTLVVAINDFRGKLDGKTQLLNTNYLAILLNRSQICNKSGRSGYPNFCTTSITAYLKE
jgi:hypothetical protein